MWSKSGISVRTSIQEQRRRWIEEQHAPTVTLEGGGTFVADDAPPLGGGHGILRRSARRDGGRAGDRGAGLAAYGVHVRPLTLVFAGFLVVTVDLNLLVGIDVLLDPVGWAMVVTGVSRLARRDRAFVVAECFGIAGLAVSVAAFVPPFGAVDLVRVADSVVQTGFVVAVCTGLMAIALDDDAGRRQADVIRWADIALTVVAVAVTLVARVTVDRLEPGAGSVGAGAGGLVLLLALAGLAVRVWFLGLLWSRSNRVYAGA